MRRVRKKSSISLLTLVIMLLISIGQHYGWFDKLNKGATTGQPGLYTVDHFVDGDTIAVNMNGTVETIRLIGIDTPETHKPNAPVQCYGPAAAAYTKNRIGFQRIRLVSDTLSTDRDRYNRLLRYVYLPDNTNVNLELVAKGYAFAYVSFPFTMSADFSAAQGKAQIQKIGLWGNCSPHLEKSGRWQSNDQS